MALTRRPRFDYGAGTSLTLTLPARPWEASLRAVGAGREESAAGVPSVWVTRREYPFRIPLRFTESEWPAVRAMVEHGQEGGTITLYPDAADTGTSYTCYLIEPELSEEVRPTRGEHWGTLELTVAFRRTTAAAIDEVYFDG